MIEFFTSSTFRTVLSALNSGFLKTLQLFFITLIGALPLGLVISFGSMSRFPPLRWLTRLVVWVIRGTPLVLQIIALFYVPGIQKWFSWPSGESGRMISVCVAFIINYACYFSEIYRGGIQGVPKGQQEAGQGGGKAKAVEFHGDRSFHRMVPVWLGGGGSDGWGLIPPAPSPVRPPGGCCLAPPL